MNTEQKVAWFTIVVCSMTLIGVVALHTLYGSAVASAAFGLMGITGFIPFFYRKKKNDPRITLDERDQIIIRKATVAGGMLSYTTFVLVSMAAWFFQFSRGHQEIAISILPFIVMCGVMTLFLTRSITLIMLYRGDSGYGEG